MWRDAALLFAAQDGVATRRELHAAGVSDSMIAVRVDLDEVVRIAPGLFRTKHHPFTDRTAIRVAGLLSGGVADRETALFWHGMTDESPSTIGVTVPVARRLRATHGYAIRTRRRALDRADVVDVDGVAVTSKALSVLEMADAKVMDRALQQGDVTLEELSEALERNAHAKGISAARAIFDIASGDTESEAERIFLALLHLHGITGWTMQLTFRGWRVDIAFPDIRLAVEINGWAFHRSRARWQSDQDKANALTVAGWSVLNFSWHHLTDDPEGVITTLAEAIGARAA
ncbi:DUF559 domain-containing protein [Tsukamurella pseudospumae]|uniref:DUF559 domain-containing protein n=1 Tax=Tsukamurella pseudospumae TaxID=239498 RepID=A0A138AU62_9ACTN|nr:DUF559 domain-containing protein [Tsukamurella pseudospumae]KXO98984.1 hypothetical protein AXK61_18785 [Tsukamurella pseudospumae]KXP13997.1 hypothetical protein AXK60_22305 [Tsukamurella pseudospumae]